MVGDLAGFIAATFTRGVRFCQIPTTLLSQVDSSVGGKVGVNLTGAKNMVGAFWQPQYVLIDTQVLSTLPDREFRSGLAEVVKYGVILDADFFAYLEKNVDGLMQRDPNVLRQVISRSCRLKADIVEADERETLGLRAVLNYGHTFAHAFGGRFGLRSIVTRRSCFDWYDLCLSACWTIGENRSFHHRASDRVARITQPSG